MILSLSPDLRLQHIAYKALESAVIKNQAISGSAILVDVLPNVISLGGPIGCYFSWWFRTHALSP